MRRRFVVICLSIFAIGAVAAGLGLFGVYKAAQEVPDFYAEAVAMPETHADKQSDDFTAGALALAGDVEKIGDWSSVFTDDQINGWLTVDLVEKHPDLLPKNFEQPRIKILNDHVQLGVRCEIGGVKTVAWMEVEGHMTKNQELAIRFRHIRAGAVPLPQSTILDAVKKTAETFDLSLHWTTENGDPIAIVGLPTHTNKGKRYELERFTLTDGLLYVSGRTFKVADKVAAAK